MIKILSQYKSDLNAPHPLICKTWMKRSTRTEAGNEDICFKIINQCPQREVKTLTYLDTIENAFAVVCAGDSESSVLTEVDRCY